MRPRVHQQPQPQLLSQPQLLLQPQPFPQPKRMMMRMISQRLLLLQLLQNIIITFLRALKFSRAALRGGQQVTELCTGRFSPLVP